MYFTYLQCVQNVYPQYRIMPLFKKYRWHIWARYSYVRIVPSRYASPHAPIRTNEFNCACVYILYTDLTFNLYACNILPFVLLCYILWQCIIRPTNILSRYWHYAVLKIVILDTLVTYWIFEVFYYLSPWIWFNHDPNVHLYSCSDRTNIEGTFL